jgi:hypothetical protein
MLRRQHNEIVLSPNSWRQAMFLYHLCDSLGQAMGASARFDVPRSLKGELSRSLADMTWAGIGTSADLTTNELGPDKLERSR